MKQTLFRVSLSFVPFYLLVFGIFFQSTTHARNPALILISFAVILPLHFFAVFSQIYSWYFVSKSVALAENQRPVSFADYAGYFFAIWIFPIGVWIIQPRVNQLYANAAPTVSS